MFIDFDYWAKLAKDDPARFEKERQEAIAKEITSAPAHHQAGLWELQKEVDNLRAKSPTPLVAAGAMIAAIQYSQKRMCEALLDLNEGLADIYISLAPLAGRSAELEFNYK